MEEIAKELNLPVEKIIEANRTAADTLSLDTPVGDEEDTTIGSFVEDDNTPGTCRRHLQRPAGRGPVGDSGDPDRPGGGCAGGCALACTMAGRTPWRR